MTHEQSYAYWFGRVNYEQKAPRPGDFKLDRMRTLLARLGDPQARFRVLHVTGSKGKGSTSAMLANVLRHQGYRVGLFTSPHLVHVEERVRVDDEPITPAELTARLAQIREAAQAPLPGEDEPLDAGLTFFEIATALGLLHFAYRRVEWAVLEVGLGGRLDSTNVCVPNVAIVTSISFDHTQQLGNTLASIAWEKAGIFKPGRPAVSGVLDPEPRAVIEKHAAFVGAPLRQLGRDFHFEHEPARIAADRPARVRVATWRAAYPWLPLNLVGAHQAANAAVAVAALECLREQGVPWTNGSLAAGLAQVDWPGRLEIVERRPLVLLDCAHNVASAQALRDTIVSSFAEPKARILVFAGNRDKDLAGMLNILQPLFDKIVLTRFASNPRNVPPERLRELLPPDAEVHLVETPAAAIALARSLATSDDLICVTGSVFLAGETRPLFRDK